VGPGLLLARRRFAIDSATVPAPRCRSPQGRRWFPLGEETGLVCDLFGKFVDIITYFSIAAKQEKAEDKAENKAAYKQEKAQNKADNKQAAFAAKKEAKAESKQAAAQEKKENKVAAKQIQKSMRSLAVSAPKPSGQRRQARKHLILSRQEGRQESKQERLENKDGMRAEARKEALFIKKSERAENKAEAKEERNDNRIAAINARQEARAERGPRPEGERREARMEKLAEVKAKYAAKKAARQKAIQLAKTWKPCGADG